MQAVSVRKIALPKLKGVNFLLNNNVVSSVEKSPSGPTNTQ
jgi:hypothetical protein